MSKNFPSIDYSKSMAQYNNQTERIFTISNCFVRTTTEDDILIRKKKESQ